MEEVMVPGIKIPEGAKLDWVACWVLCPADQYEEIAQHLVDEHGAEVKQRFDPRTGERVQFPAVEWSDEREGSPRKVVYELAVQR